jgi:hypothetical protein
MLFYVVKCFTVNLENLATDAVRRAQLCRIDKQIKGDRGFVAVTFGETAHEVYQISALYAEGAKVSDDLAELSTLVFDGLLKGGEAGNGLIRRGRDTAAEDVQLDFDAEKGLENPVVKVASDAAAFCFDGAGAQVPQKKDVFERRTDMRSNALEPS